MGKNITIRRIGIDFGTSTTVFAYKDYDKNGNPLSNSAPKLLELGGRVMFPTIVFEPEGEDVRVYGFDAEAESLISSGTLYTNFKMDLMSEERHDKAYELILGYFDYLRNIYKEECNRIGNVEVEETWLSYPAAWPDHIQTEMEKIACETGFANVHIMDEPTAAINSVLYQYKDQLQCNKLLTEGEPANVLIIDMGAGTTDLVVCRFIPGDEKPVERLLSWPPADSGDYFGGREMDDRLTEYCICYCEAHNSLGRDFRKISKKISRNIKKWKEGEFSRALQTKRKPPVPEIVESNVPNILEQNDFKIVDRKSFEDVLEGLLETFPKIVYDCASKLQNCEIGFDLFAETDIVILTGGNSSWYFIDEYLLGKREAKAGNVGFLKLQNQPERMLRMGQPQQTVAYGLTLNDKILKDISEQFKAKSPVKPQQIGQAVLSRADNVKSLLAAKTKEKEISIKKEKEISIKKEKEISIKKIKELTGFVELVHEAEMATRDSNLLLTIPGTPVAWEIATRLAKGDTDFRSYYSFVVKNDTNFSKRLKADASVLPDIYMLASPLPVMASPQARKKQLYDEKERLLCEIARQIKNVKKVREQETNVVEARRQLMEALEVGLAAAAQELQNYRTV